MTILALGYEPVQQSLAQLSGSYITPVSFSFGWPVYALRLLLAVLGKASLMPEPDYNVTVVNLSNGITRLNKSWVLGRILRDYDYWKPKKIDGEVKRVLNEADYKARDKEKRLALEEGRRENPINPRIQAGLVIAAFRRAPNKSEGKSRMDVVYYSGIVVTVLQLHIASVMCIHYQENPSYLVLAITAVGTALAYGTGALPQWAAEKWACRRLAPGMTKNVALTLGNGAQHALVIAGEKGALDLEDLANGTAHVPTMLKTRIFAVISAIAWTALSLSVTSIPDKYAWFLLGIGVLGSVQNLLVARSPRKPESMGLQLEMDNGLQVIGNVKVERALDELEEKFPPFGENLLKVFFPDGLREDEKRRWKGRTEARLRRETEEQQAREEAQRRSELESRRVVSMETEEV
jgi:hypothetical protein